MIAIMLIIGIYAVCSTIYYRMQIKGYKASINLMLQSMDTAAHIRAFKAVENFKNKVESSNGKEAMKLINEQAGINDQR